jgi:hypothetical protein
MIDAKDIGNVLAEKTWIPVNIVNEDEITKLKRLKGIPRRRPTDISFFSYFFLFLIHYIFAT